MKEKITFYVFIIFSISLNAQIFTPFGTVQASSGGLSNIGIGTNAPTDLLNVHGGHGNSRIVLHSAGGGDDGYQADLVLWASEPGLTYTGVGIGNNVHNFNNANGGIRLLNPVRGGSYLRLLNGAMTFNVFSAAAEDRQALVINPEGNLGINTENPTAKLEILGSSQVGYEIGTLKLKSSMQNQFMYFGYDDQYAAGYIQSVKPGTDQQNLLLAPAGGNVGVGTKSPDAKLAVNGTIHSKEVKVDMSGWSDFVFQSEYRLPTLEEVEKHIVEKGHLENIPNEKEVLEKGINLGEMDAKLLQKIEELTLYVIELKRENKEAKMRIQKLEDR